MKRKGARRSFEKERAWRGVLERQRESGLSIRAFCRRESLSEPSFYAWRRELQQRDRESVGVRVRDPELRRRLRSTRISSSARGWESARPKVAPAMAAFVPMTITATESVGRVLEVCCADGLRLSVWPGCDATLLQAALRVLATHAVGHLPGEAASC